MDAGGMKDKPASDPLGSKVTLLSVDREAGLGSIEVEANGKKFKFDNIELAPPSGAI
ncbi:hypothetical protein H0H92_010451, partial [Tricholoma furcatifolium]